jgi:sterol desaturase/sphingolipid hydroxylase (fatty acid hydroxylase superfamily)
MRRFVLLTVAGAALAVVTPQFASAAPGMGGGLIPVAAQTISPVEDVHYRCCHRHRHCHWRCHWRCHGYHHRSY